MILTTGTDDTGHDFPDSIDPEGVLKRSGMICNLDDLVTVGANAADVNVPEALLDFVRPDPQFTRSLQALDGYLRQTVMVQAHSYPFRKMYPSPAACFT